MYDHNQIEVPASFLALYVVNGRLPAAATRSEVSRRYELCEDLACRLVDYAALQQRDLALTEAEVLGRCRQGLSGDASGFSAAEADWVICRLAELAGWPTDGDAPPPPHP